MLCIGSLYPKAMTAIVAIAAIAVYFVYPVYQVYKQKNRPFPLGNRRPLT